MRHKFYLPLGMPVFSAPPVDPAEASFQVGDTYFDTVIKKVVTWDGTKWLSGGQEVIAGNGLISEAGVGDAMALHVQAKDGVKVTSDFLVLDVPFTDAKYLKRTGDQISGPLLVPHPPTAPTQAASKQYVDEARAAAGVFSIGAGSGLTGGGRVDSNPTLNVNGGWGITVGADNVYVSSPDLDARYSINGHGHSYAAVDHGHNYSAPHDHPYSPAGHAHGQMSVMAGGSVAVPGGSGSITAAGFWIPPYFGGVVPTIATANTTVPETTVKAWGNDAGVNYTAPHVYRTNSTATWFHVMFFG